MEEGGASAEEKAYKAELLAKFQQQTYAPPDVGRFFLACTGWDLLVEIISSVACQD